MAASDEAQERLKLERYQGRGRRRAISAATTSISDSDFVPPVFPKNPDELGRISQVIQRCLLFKHLDEDERKTVISAMFEVGVEAGTKIIEQG
ncbi:MAG: hypothetical protein Q8P67_21000, partial [archaeon]|nr:hypothetical protein [archaeon]